MNPLLTLFLCGDVMLGRGVDQILPNPGNPELHERSARNARTYVELAEEENGPIRDPVTYEYIWGDALAVLEQAKPAARIINLETAVTTSGDFWPGKGIHYRMHPQNVGVLRAAKIDVATLGNNHTLDWGRDGLAESLQALQRAGIAAPGAGEGLDEARAPAEMNLGDGRRLLVFSCATDSSGVPEEWAASDLQSGLFYLPALNDTTADLMGGVIRAHARPSDVVVLSIHWGGNWGYDIPPEQVRFARHLIDTADVDIIHGHSSHHIKGIEVYRDRLILYGAGDFINDYEGLGGKEAFRPDLRLMYLPSLDAQTGALRALRVVPLRTKQMRLIRTTPADLRWTRALLDDQSEPFDVQFAPDGNGGLVGRWKD